MKCRSVFAATPVFLPYSLVVATPVKNVDLKLILDSTRLLWSYWGLDDFDFDFILHKEALNFYTNNKSNSILDFFSFPSSLYEVCKLLVFSEFFNTFFFQNKVSFEKDCFILKNQDNLTTLEQELGFFSRDFPKVLNNVYISDSQLGDDIIRGALEQRKLYNLRMKSSIKI